MEVLEQTGDNLKAARLTEAEKNALSVYRKRLDELKKLQSRQDSERARLAESRSRSEKNRLQGSIDSIQKQIDRAQRDAGRKERKTEIRTLTRV